MGPFCSPSLDPILAWGTRHPRTMCLAGAVPTPAGAQGPSEHGASTPVCWQHVIASWAAKLPSSRETAPSPTLLNVAASPLPTRRCISLNTQAHCSDGDEKPEKSMRKGVLPGKVDMDPSLAKAELKPIHLMWKCHCLAIWSLAAIWPGTGYGALHWSVID
ncbi:hypothetical protein PG985_007886 [Apiospora marii]|uniref:Uncharacterized protein n=1 Tax=Apiospora marii TaxID=335849 RepID=A0ABR1R8R1_9PEZI